MYVCVCIDIVLCKQSIFRTGRYTTSNRGQIQTSTGGTILYYFSLYMYYDIYSLFMFDKMFQFYSFVFICYD